MQAEQLDIHIGGGKRGKGGRTFTPTLHYTQGYI